MTEAESQSDYDRYTQELVPLFKLLEVDLFPLVCSLLRVGGKMDHGMDSLEESREVLNDLVQLNQLSLPSNLFADMNKTHWRLHLLSYIHLIEMNAPYHMITNLLRIRCGLPYTFTPFREYKEQFVSTGSVSRRQHSYVNPSPMVKIGEIKMLAVKAGFPHVGSLFDEFFIPALRNAVAHSDYALTDKALYLFHKKIPDESDKSQLTSYIPFDRLEKIVSKAYNFYSAFFILESLARQEVVEYASDVFPYDQKLKGLVELLTHKDNQLSGFKIHWPNGIESIYQRFEEGCRTKNVKTDRNGCLIFYSGKKPRKSDPFSPLIPCGKKPRYTPATDSDIPLKWPDEI